MLWLNMKISKRKKPMTNIVEQLRNSNDRLLMLGQDYSDVLLDAAIEIEWLRKNAKQDAQYLLAYHRICQKHGIAPSSSDLIAALKETQND